MSKPRFKWHPDLGAQSTTKASVNKTKFGDGYELRVAEGINYTPVSWNVKFSRPGQAAKDILAFLKARGGLESFVWTDPLGNEATYVCREWSGSQQVFGVYTISASFEQVYEY